MHLMRLWPKKIDNGLPTYLRKPALPISCKALRNRCGKVQVILIAETFKAQTISSTADDRSFTTVGYGLKLTDISDTRILCSSLY